MTTFDMPKTGSWGRLRPLAIPERRRCHNAFYRPPSLQPLNERCWSDTNAPRRFGHRQRFAAPINEHIVSSVRRLFLTRRPSNIPRFISPIVVDPLQGIAFRARADIFRKSLEIAYPFVAYRNAATAVVPVVRGIRVKAAIFHPLPYTINIRPTLSVREICGGCAVALPAATTPGGTGVSSAKIILPEITAVPAIAETKPTPPTSARWRFRDYLQPTKSFADHAGVLP